METLTIRPLLPQGQDISFRLFPVGVGLRETFTISFRLRFESSMSPSATQIEYHTVV